MADSIHIESLLLVTSQWWKRDITFVKLVLFHDELRAYSASPPFLVGGDGGACWSGRGDVGLQRGRGDGSAHLQQGCLGGGGGLGAQGLSSTELAQGAGGSDLA